jgi:ammonium transporter, Amt family
VVTTVILHGVSLVIPLRIPCDQLKIGDNAAHGEEAYALWGYGERFDVKRQEAARPRPWSNGVAEETADQGLGARGVTIRL